MNNNKLIYLLVASCIVFSVQSCSKKGGQTQYGGAVPVVDYTVQSHRVSFYDSYPGTVTALNEVAIHSQVSGYITGIFFREGTLVEKGEKLYEIDRRKYKAAFEEAKAGKDIADANLEKAQRDADRYTKLNEQNAIAKQTFDDAITGLQNARLQLLSAKAALLSAETDYNYSIITAPFSGTIGFSQVKAGAFVVAGQTLLNTISSDDPIGVDFIVNEKSLPNFLDLQKDKNSSADSTFRITLPDNSDYPFFGKLTVIGRGVDPLTGTIRIRLVFPNNEKRLRTGMNCSVKVLGRNTGEQLVIPFRAVVEQMGEYFVYRIDSMKVTQVRITPGANLGEQIVVMGGIKAGDKIVLEGLQKVHNGSMVSVGGPPAGQAMGTR